MKTNYTKKVLGITGGIGSGKSTIARMFKEFGATIIDADKICHELLDTPKIQKKIINIWPELANDESKKINRTKLGKIAFSSKNDIETLNKIIHPIVIKKIKQDIAELNKNQKDEIIIIDAALIEETNLSSLCDLVIFIETKKTIRSKRCQTDRNWNVTEISKREKFQIPTNTKKKRAKVVINNNMTKDCTRDQVHEFWQVFIGNK